MRDENRADCAGSYDARQSAVPILLVTDQPANLETLQSMLAPLGQTLITASSGDEAVRNLLAHDVAVVLLDMPMGGTSGLETARRIRDGGSRRTPLILIAADASDPGFPVAETYALGAVDCLVKPLVPETLRSKVRVFVELFQKTDELRRQSEQLRLEIDRRKRVEAVLRDQLGRWQVTLSSIADAVIVADAEGRIAFTNTAAEVLCGWSRTEAAGKPLEEVFRIISATTREPLENPVARVLRTGDVVAQAPSWLLVDRSGRETVIDDSAAPVRDELGAITGVVLIFRDVSERRKAEEVSERLAAIVESSDDAIVSKNLHGIITSWNKGAERLFGYSAGEVIGKHISMLMPLFLKEDVNRILDRIRRDERVDHYQTRRVRKDGQIIDVSLTVSPVKDGSGRIIGASKIARDITAQKRAEAERAEADRRKDEFLAMLAHELRNPISAISNAARILGQPGMENDFAWARGVVERHVKHLAHMMDDLLDVSRITRGLIQLRRQRVEAGPIVRCALDDVKPLVAEQHHRMAVSIEPGTLWLDADPMRLQQIVVNLLTNAARYTDPGGDLALDARREADQVVITVRDTGRGIPSGELASVFDSFTQGQRSLARSEGGLGIGLSLVRSLVELHGGRVQAASEGSGKGSAFTVHLPAAPPLAIAHTDMPALPAPGKAARVLVVDDNVDIARSLAKLLRVLGHDVRVAHDGIAALVTAREHRPEVVLLDLGLPGMDGYQVAARLRLEENLKHAIIIAITGYGHDRDRRRAREAGFDHHLVKPVDYNTLLNLIH
jgi:PAS domain S-box-containing protein